MGDHRREEEIHELLNRMHLKEKEEAVSKKHSFWETQPVKQFQEENNEDVSERQSQKALLSSSTQ